MKSKRAKRIFWGILAVASAACACSKPQVAKWPLANVQILADRCEIERKSPVEMEAGCEAGDKAGCACLVDIYLLSLSAPQMVDYKFGNKSFGLIVKWWIGTREDYADACAKGEGDACANAFGMWLAKEFNSYSEPKAFEYMEKGCELENAQSCFFLGSAWQSGYPAVPGKDEEKARRAFEKACDLGHKESCSQMELY